MLRPAISHARLMRASTDRVQSALTGSDGNAQLIARRILESPVVRRQWEYEHSGLMRQLANCGLQRTQVLALKHITFRLLHGKALFQYLRRGDIRGAQRVRVMAHLRPGRHYPNALVTEHSAYLRKAASYLCTQHLGSDVVEDPAFLDPIPRYEELYNEYFNLYCCILVGGHEGAIAQAGLLPLLKKQLSEYRWAILDPKRAQPFLRREAGLRAPSGDTQRLPVFEPHPE